MDEHTQIELEAAAFRHLIGFLQEKTDVQNIDLMNLAGFCRNCLSKWYMAWIMRKPERLFTVCHIQSGRIDIKNKQARLIDKYKILFA